MANDSTFRLVDRPGCIVWLDRPVETAGGGGGADVEFSVNLRTTFTRPKSRRGPRRVAGVQTMLRVPEDGLDGEAVAAMLSIGHVPAAVTRASLGFVVAKILGKARRAVEGRRASGGPPRRVVIPLTVFVILMVDRIPRDLCNGGNGDDDGDGCCGGDEDI